MTTGTTSLEIYTAEEGDMIFEWRGQDFRFGLAFDNQGCSSWFYVRRNPHEMYSGDLTDEVLQSFQEAITLTTNRNESAYV